MTLTNTGTTAQRVLSSDGAGDFVFSNIDIGTYTLTITKQGFETFSQPNIGIIARESRHIDAVRQLTWHDIVEGRKMPDSIGLGAWGVEWHDRKTFESTFVYPPDKGCYEIPLGCLISADTPNLFAAGRVVDADQQAGASVRVMGTAFATGQAAGVAAAMFAQTGTSDAQAVRRMLVGQDALIDAGALLT